jgi:hypothetical protein
MDARQVNAGNAWGWIVGGFNLFRQNPVIWIALFFIYLLVAMVLSIIPLVGPIVLNLLAPVFMAGFMLGCRALEMDEELEINHLFAGFKNNTAQLVTVGGIYLVGAILIVGLVFVLVGADAMTGVFGGQVDSIRPALEADRSDPAVPGLALLVVLGAMLPLIMAYWFAPALVLFHDMKALDAMRLSFFACLRNVLPFTVYGAISAILLVIAMIPLGLGLLVMIPTMTASLYVSYKDIFNIGKLEVDEVLSEN